MDGHYVRKFGHRQDVMLLNYQFEQLSKGQFFRIFKIFFFIFVGFL